MLLSLLLSLATAQTLPAGSEVERAASIQITTDGLNNFGTVLPGLVPESFPIDPISSEGGGSGCFGYEVDIYNLDAGIGVTGVAFNPRTGILDLQADLLINLNDSGNPFNLDYRWCSSNECTGWVRPFPVQADIPFQIAVETAPDGTRYVDAEVGTIELDLGLTNEHIQLNGDCGGIQTLDQILSLANLSFYQFIIDNVEPFLLAELQSQAEDIELTIEEALTQARYEDTVDLAGAELQVLVEPRDIDITPYGLQIDMLGRIHAEQATCIAQHDIGGSAWTDTRVPELEDASDDTVVHLSDDLANQGLYGVWRSGILCYEVGGDSELDIGFPINSSLLGVLGGEGFDEIIPEERELIIRTDPRTPPTAAFDGGHDLTAQVRGLDVNFYTEVDGRQARALGITIEADAGVDLLFDNVTGVLAADIALGADNIRPIASHNQLVASATADIESNFSGLLDVLLDRLVGDSLDGIAFGLPAYEGVGLASAAVGPTGDGDWLGIAAEVGEVSYSGSGCDQGCSGDATGGCSAARGGLGALFFLVPLLALRRRRS